VEDWILEMKNITKEFSGVTVLDDVSIRMRRGEIHAICGENGAGKSTLMKVLSGVYPSGTYTGEIYIKGQLAQFSNVLDSEQRGITIIHQELNLVPEFTIAENIFLGRELGSFGILATEEMHLEAQKLLNRVGLSAKPDEKVKYLGVGEQQLVEIAKALKNNADILILDEPTAALTNREVDTLFEILRQLQNEGVTNLYISHKLREVLDLTQNVTVLRDGKVVGTRETKDLKESDLVSMMVGREFTNFFPKEVSEPGETVLDVRNLSVKGKNSGRTVVRDVSFHVREGEVVGLAGLVGAGRTELVSSLFGAYEGTCTGEIRFLGKPIRIRNPIDAIENGMALVTEDRKRFGLVLGMSVQKNIMLAYTTRKRSGLVINDIEEISLSRKTSSDLKLKAASLEAEIKTLSGGNQQKVVLGKWLLMNPKLLILDEPTRGIDVGAKYEIYQLINQLTAKGIAIIMISSELPEVIGMSDRIIVMAGGALQGEVKRDEANEERIMKLATGGR